MYIPKEFEVKDKEAIWNFILENTFAIVISSLSDQLEITHLPLVPKRTNQDYFLEGHLALANPHAQLLIDKRKVKVIFQGAHGYISSSVYGHANVPTWNYQAVHVDGTVETLSDEELTVHLSELVELNEKGRDQVLKYSELDQTLIESYKKEIVGFRIRIKNFEASFKLSQNRNESDFKAIVDDLNKCPHLSSLAESMRKNRD
ncbi:MAG: FMN-binding negative transcriptional regulator [Bacteroidetes bacterium]|nr:FMN-binding negative transcriptional regulator [Bacteroidota bacterium]